MAVLALSFLRALSFQGAEALLLQEGYVEEPCIEAADEQYERKFLYPYSLYSGTGAVIDRIYYIEHCNRELDVEYSDGRVTWEEQTAEWKRDPSFHA